ncbi:MAG: Anaerobic dimethyl sulfoxide reductase chain A, molybdopterin-binding domain, partial [uncultured Lysobacter sp.]
RRDHRAGEIRRQRTARHGVDVERDRQAQGRVETRQGCARRPAGFPAQSPDLRHHSARRLRECRPCYRTGRVVRPARAHRARRSPGGARWRTRGVAGFRAARIGQCIRAAAALRRAVPSRPQHPRGLM